MKIIYRDKYKSGCGWGFGFAACSLIEEYKDFEVTVILEESGEIMAMLTYARDKDDIISGDPEKSFNAKWRNPELSTLGRQRTQLLQKKDLPEEYKKFISLMIDIAHEVGHMKYHRTEGKSNIDMDLYKKDLEYRLKIESEAEVEATRVAKKYGFYNLINEIDY